ncbi:MAG: sarcosine oxidase subunit gamma [Pseudomonadota bacterium]
MVEPVSALAGHLEPRVVGADAGSLSLSEAPVGGLWLLAAWPDRLAEVGAAIARLGGVKAVPGPGRFSAGPKGTAVIRVEPLKWLLLSPVAIAAPTLDPSLGTVLDLSHARTCIRIAGDARADLMARLVPLDLRPEAFPKGSVASSGVEGVGVTLLSHDAYFDMLVPRSFGLSVWERVLVSAAPLGARIGKE